ncbi:hypothetical protein [Streptomyces sp. C]|uniref:hypothetical protein n=1 Tax=Streptomyces sp. C TaxID=253839 RepID=UPI0001B54151|nr:hypothetical protein [Streptomyces sp. C]
MTELGAAPYAEAFSVLVRRKAELKEGLDPGRREAAPAWRAAVASACQEPVDGCDQ